MSGRSTPASRQNAQHLRQQSQRHSRNLQHLRKVQLEGVRSNSSENVFASLRATEMVGIKSVLPAELMATILEYLPVRDLMRFALVSRRMQEMVYDDTRWIQKLKAMGAWNDVEARQRFEEAMKRKADGQKVKDNDESRRNGINLPGSETGNDAIAGNRRNTTSTTLFDASEEEQRRLPKPSEDAQQSQPNRRRTTLAEGFDELTISPSSTSSTSWNTHAALHVFDRIRSVRGYARQEYGKIHGALNPIYQDLASTQGHSDAMLFRRFRDPEQQAQVLANLRRFSKSDNTPGYLQRQERLDTTIGIFENAVLHEFEQGYAANDIAGRMRRYAHCLVTLNGGNSGVDAFISNHPLMARTMRLGNPVECLDGVAYGHVDIQPCQSFFERLAAIMVEQAAIIDNVFPPSVDVLTPFLSRTCDSVVSDYVTTLVDEAHSKDIETYVKAVAGSFAQALRFVASLKPTKASPPDFAEKAKQTVLECFEKHADLYLAEELSVFQSRADAHVSQWDKELSEQEASTESFFMSNVSRQAAKRDFLSSFKKVIMMPVNALPAFPTSSKPISAASRSSANLSSTDTAYFGATTRTPPLTGPSTPPLRSSTPQNEPPTTELAAKAAIMKSRLEGIKTLFSLEVALTLTNLAKASIERAALMVQMGGTYGTQAKEQCGAIFVALLDTLGNRHVKDGFDKAVTHLGNYDPREVRKFREQNSGIGSSNSSSSMATAVAEGETAAGVEPLVTFIELVNVGDLIQQMVDVFYSQELIAPRLAERDDFIDPAVKEKRKFEQMLDERVAAGLNKGIDVLMDEVEYICATTQTPTDFNPAAANAAPSRHSQLGGIIPAAAADAAPPPPVVDIGRSTTATQVVDMVASHTGMLVGSTDKNMLDVFTQEVGLRLFTVLCKHFKRQRVSVDGAVTLIADINHYAGFVASLRQKPLLPYFHALRELSQIYLVYIDPPAAYFGGGGGGGSGGGGGGKRGSILSSRSSSTAVQSKELATIIADTQRYHGIFSAEEVYEFAERRADWYLVKGDVERAMYGVGCSVM